MITIRETQDSVFEEFDAYSRAAMMEFFSDEFDKEWKEAFEEGRLQSLYELIFKNYRRRHNADISEKYAAKINGTNYYPALEDIQYAACASSSPAEFEREVDSILDGHWKKLEALSKKK